MKRTGPETESWGTPQIRSEGNDFTSFTVTVFYLPGKSKARTEQDHKYRKCFRGESEGLCRKQPLAPEESEWRESRNLKQSGSH